MGPSSNLERKVLTLLLAATSAGMIGSALWSLAGAFHWFENLPAGLEDTGPANGHLIRDVGFAYLVFGVSLLFCVVRRPVSRPLFLAVTAFAALHALGHVAEISTGALPHSHWFVDFPLVFLPALVLGYAALPATWRRWQ